MSSIVRVIQRRIFPSLQIIPSMSASTHGITKNSSEGSSALSSNSIGFNNSREAFGHFRTRELLRSYLVLSVCAIEPLVAQSYELMKTCKKILGPFILRKLMSPFYTQFVSGDSEEQMRSAARSLADIGINLMIAPMFETDLGEMEKSGENLYDTNLKKTLHLLDLSHQCRRRTDNYLRPVCQTKITAFINAEILFKISSLYESLSTRERYSLVESVADFMKQNSSESGLTETKFKEIFKLRHEEIEFVQCLHRLMEIGKLSKEKNVILTVDAEYSYFNPAISLLTLAMMLTFNECQPVIWNTYQSYLKSTKYWLKHDLELICHFGSSFGGKIVRGAYLERERQLSRLNNSPDPINETYEITNKSYEELIDLLFPLVLSSPQKYQMIAATHNEKSVLNLIARMKKAHISNCSPSILFGQIYGMAEYISVPLSKEGYSIYKSVPYGDINEVLPYLSRRANENRAVFKGARRERNLMEEEIRRRLVNNFLFKQ